MLRDIVNITIPLHMLWFSRQLELYSAGRGEVLNSRSYYCNVLNGKVSNDADSTMFNWRKRPRHSTVTEGMVCLDIREV